TALRIKETIMKQQTEQWTSKLGFILATAGSAIGLGAIWKFPYMVGESGGGIFLLIFILFTLLVGLPILLSEFIIGRGSQKDAIRAYTVLGANRSWRYIGILGMMTCFILLSFYSGLRCSRGRVGSRSSPRRRDSGDTGRRRCRSHCSPHERIRRWATRDHRRRRIRR